MTHLKHQFRTQKRFQSATAIMTVVCPEHLSQILCDIDAKLAAINERLERQADLLSKIGTIVGTQKECRRCKTASRRKKKGRKLGKSSAETIGTIGERFDSHISRFSRGSSSTEPRHKRPQYIDPLSPWPDIIPRSSIPTQEGEANAPVPETKNLDGMRVDAPRIQQINQALAVPQCNGDDTCILPLNTGSAGHSAIATT